MHDARYGGERDPVNGKNVPKMKDFDDFFHNKRVFVCWHFVRRPLPQRFLFLVRFFCLREIIIYLVVNIFPFFSVFSFIYLYFLRWIVKLLNCKIDWLPIQSTIQLIYAACAGIFLSLFLTSSVRFRMHLWYLQICFIILEQSGSYIDFNLLQIVCTMPFCNLALCSRTRLINTPWVHLIINNNHQLDLRKVIVRARDFFHPKSEVWYFVTLKLMMCIYLNLIALLLHDDNDKPTFRFGVVSPDRKWHHTNQCAAV